MGRPRVHILHSLLFSVVSSTTYSVHLVTVTTINGFHVSCVPHEFNRDGLLKFWNVLCVSSTCVAA